MSPATATAIPAIEPAHLPDDPALLKAMLAEVLVALQASRQEGDRLRERLNQLLRRLYGPRSERLNPDMRRQLREVFDRHFAVWAGHFSSQPAVRRAADFAIELNTQLFGSFHGRKPRWPSLARDFVFLGPAAWYRFLRDSRITERVQARLRAGLLNSTMRARRIT